MTSPVPPDTANGTKKFYVLRASDDLLTFTLVGVQEANSRDQAIRKQFGKTPPVAVAVSENAFKVRKPKTVAVVRGLTDVPVPWPNDSETVTTQITAWPIREDDDE